MATRKKRRRFWAGTEVSRLRNMARKRVPAPEIADRLGRTEGATRQKACAIGLSLETRDGMRQAA
jgi:hypothetical protein